MDSAIRRTRVFEELAVVGKAFGSAKRLELVDLLAQGERTVDGLARVAGMGVTTVSAHLQVLRLANLVRTRREGTRVHYRLAGDDVAGLYAAMRNLARERSADVGQALEAYLNLPGSDDVNLVSREELSRLLESGEITLLDVRPEEEFAAGHIPGARNVPLGALSGSGRRAARHPRGRRLLSRQLLCHGARCSPPARGGRSRGQAPRGRHAGVAYAWSPGRGRGRVTVVPLVVLGSWSLRRWLTVGGAAIVFVLLVAIPTDLIDTPAFGREIPATWWAWPSLIASSVLGGLLVATYVAAPDQSAATASPRGGWVGAVLTYFAVGCPVCNKLVLLALGSAGAITWFEPVQPVLQALALALLGWALRSRLLGEMSCPTTTSGDVARV